ncbi:MAG: SGNH/GDSL hydrolase family protein [Bacteroidia bacterium]|nr:SGNH/GDSL hydrolase family protein [Bacteroidia bacterium]
MKKFKVQFIIFLVLFLLAEIVLRVMGMKSGTLIDDFGIEDHPQYMKRFVSDEMGINHIYPNAETLMLGTVINEQGFRGKFDYTKASVDSIRKYTGRKIVMIVGDSYVEGCCADTMKNSFPDLLANGPRYEVLNFGVSGTDPIQYDLIVKKYAKELRPDIVLVVVYFGNDFLTYDRKPTPGTPLTFPFKKNKWIYAIATNHLSKEVNYAFKTSDEAYDFYMQHYTLRGKDRNWFQKTISHSVIISKLYLFAEHKIKKYEWDKIAPTTLVDVNEITHKRFKSIQKECDSLSIPCVFAGIPMPTEGTEGSALKTKYKNFFQEVPYNVPTNFSEKDYDGTDMANHFNNNGHKKYAEFLLNLLDKKK